MYDTQFVADRIKTQVKNVGCTMKIMLSDLGLGVNTVSHLAKGQEISYLNLAKIADYLDCSVDYLLGRTDNPNITADTYINGDNNNNGQQAINGNVTVNNSSENKKDTLTEQFMQKFEQLDFDDKVDVMQYVKNKK